MTKRTMHGVADYSGERVNNLVIGEMTSRYPSPRYATICQTCGAKSTAAQKDIANGAARCLSSDCGTEKLRNELRTTPRRLELQRAERQRAKIAALESEFKATTNAIARTVRDRIAGQKDDELYVSLELVGAKMSNADATKFNREQAAKFIREYAEYDAYRSDESLKAIGDYFARNGIAIADAAMIRAAFLRLKEYGLIQPNPVAEIEPEPMPAEPVAETQSASQPSEPEMFEGRDPQTGRPRLYSRREVYVMDADTYRRTFKVAPTIKDWFVAANEAQS